MRYLLDTNVVSDLVRHPRGRITDRIAQVGEENVGTSIIVAAELRYGAAKKGSSRLSEQLETILGALEVFRSRRLPTRSMAACGPTSSGSGR